jgi:hypothetical protein
MIGADRGRDEIALLRRSRIIALTIRIAGICAACMRNSRAMGAVRKHQREFLALTLAARIRCLAITLAVAASVHIVLLRVIPTRLRPAVPTTLWIVVAAVGAAVAIAVPTFAVVWRARKSGWRGRRG